MEAKPQQQSDEAANNSNEENSGRAFVRGEHGMGLLSKEEILHHFKQEEGCDKIDQRSLSACSPQPPCFKVEHLVLSLAPLRAFAPPPPDGRNIAPLHGITDKHTHAATLKKGVRGKKHVAYASLLLARASLKWCNISCVHRTSISQHQKLR